MFDLAKDWTCLLEYNAASGKVKVTFNKKGGGEVAPAATLTLTISSIQDSGGIQRGIVLDK